MFDPQFLSLPTMPENPRFIQFEPNNYRVKKTNYICEQKTENTTQLRKYWLSGLLPYAIRKYWTLGVQKLNSWVNERLP